MVHKKDKNKAYAVKLYYDISCSVTYCRPLNGASVTWCVELHFHGRSKLLYRNREVTDRRRKSHTFGSLNACRYYSWNVSSGATNLATAHLTKSVVSTVKWSDRAFRYDGRSSANPPCSLCHPLHRILGCSERIYGTNIEHFVWARDKFPPTYTHCSLR